MRTCSPTQRFTGVAAWVLQHPSGEGSLFTSGQLARALLLVLTKLLDRIVTRQCIGVPE